MSVVRTEIWRGDERVAQLAPDDRGLAYGDGLFETVLLRGARCEWLDFHLDRLQTGCERLQLPVQRDRVRQRVTAFVQGVPTSPHSLKITLTRGSGPRGYRAPEMAQPTLMLGLRSIALPAPEDYQQGITARLCQHRLSINPSLAGLKHLNRLEQVMAATEWRDSAVREGLMLDTEGALVEATAANLFLVRDGRLLTPLLDRCGVAGVMRRVVMERLAPALGLVCQEGRLSLRDLRAADELLLSNSLVGLLPVRQFEDVNFAIGDVSRRLIAELERVRHE